MDNRERVLRMASLYVVPEAGVMVRLTLMDEDFAKIREMVVRGARYYPESAAAWLAEYDDLMNLRALGK